MAGRSTVEAQCRRLNAARNVHRVGACSRRQFWSRAWGGFLISGGTASSRSEMLSEKLAGELGRGGLPTLLITTSGSTAEEMIRRARAGETGGSIFVTGAGYPNYLFFRGWEESDIARFLTSAAVLMNYPTLSLPVYIEAFAHILSRYYEPDLSAMLALAAFDDGTIAEIGESAGADPMQVNNIRLLTGEGRMLRAMLRQLQGVFAPLSAKDPGAGYSLAAEGAESGALYILQVNSRFRALMNLYFAEELNIVMARERVRLVLEDPAFGREDPLRELLEQAMQRGEEVGISTVDAVALLGETARGFSAIAVLLDGTRPAGNLSGLLSPLGTYTHYEPMVAVHAPPVPIALFKSRSWSAQSVPNQPRVRPQDVLGCEAVLFGMSGTEIRIVGRLTS